MNRGYLTPWEYYQDELQRIDLIIRRQLLGTLAKRTSQPLDQLKGLVITDEEIAELLGDHPSHTSDRDDVQEAYRQLTDQLHQLEAHIEQRLAHSDKQKELPLLYLARKFALSYWEWQVILFCLAMELDRKYEKLYAYLQDDITSKYPTLALLIGLLTKTDEERAELREALSPRGKLMTHFLRDSEAADVTLMAKPLHLDERMVRFLLDEEALDDSMNSFVDWYEPGDPLPELLIDFDLQQKLRNFAIACYQDMKQLERKNLIFFLYGPPGSGKSLHTKHFCHYFDQSLMLVDLQYLLRAENQPYSFGQWLSRIFREAILLEAVVCFTRFQLLFCEDYGNGRKLPDLVEAMRQFSGILFLHADKDLPVTELQEKHTWIKVELEIPDELSRQKLWKELATDYPLAQEVDFGMMASKFRLTAGQIANALQTGHQLAIWKHGRDAKITPTELAAGCYQQIQHKLEEKAVRLRPKYTWDDVILPTAQKKLLRNAIDQVRYRHLVYGEWGFERRISYGKGLSMLFTGPPGTGKTMSAEMMANELQLEIYKIDLAQVISKYIGETEQNLQKIFREAQLSNAILFFDEADALFGKRSEVKDAHDKYANVETAFLLQKMEEYHGISILASNFLQNIDEAFLRRITFVVKFPFPDAEQRQLIWRSIFPQEAHIDTDVDFSWLAEKFEIAGGNIKNAAVAAAFLAAAEGKPIGMKHLLQAIVHEVGKAGGIIRKEQLGIYGEELTLG